MSWVVAAGIMENYVTGEIDDVDNYVYHTYLISATMFYVRKLLTFDIAFQALVTIANVKQGENVLIHTGASGA
jgi:hypothetical protein